MWRTPSFQRWYTAQRHAGNTLLGARAVWTFRLAPGTVFFWALHVRVHVAAEDRIKSNEVVISRPDVSVVALYRRGPTRDETAVVLVREFRSPASTPDGNVHELPGGSSLHPSTPLTEAADEVEEETGLAIDASRLREHGSRQVAATVSAHHAHLFSAEITDEELARLRAARDQPHGVHAEDERTWVEIAMYGEIRRRVSSTGRLSACSPRRWIDCGSASREHMAVAVRPGHTLVKCRKTVRSSTDGCRYQRQLSVR